MTLAAPYPKDTRAKGWRFELDMERVVQSDTWDLAAEIPMAQHALLMMWVTAWQQVPCGSMPADPALIRAKLKVPAALWEPMRDVVMRGWTLADDGRLYHPTITERVLGMLSSKEGERKRKADYRARMAAERQAKELASDDERPQPSEGLGSPDLSHGTDEGLTTDSSGKDATGTGTGTGLFNTTNGGLTPHTAGADAHESTDVPGDKTTPTPAARVCIALRRAGVANVNPASPRLLALIDAGATTPEFLAHAAKALDSGNNPFAYLLGAVEGERKRAAATRHQLHHGAMPQQAKAGYRERDADFAASEASRLTGGLVGRSAPAAQVIDITPKNLELEHARDA